MKYFNITDTDQDLTYWINQAFVNESDREELSKSDILLIPTIDFERGLGPTFAKRTESIYEFLKSKTPESIHVDICVSEEYYSELSLNFDYLQIGEFLVNTISLPIFLNLVSEYLKAKIIKTDRPEPNISTVILTESLEDAKDVIYPDHLKTPLIKLSITVVNDKGVSKKINYEGSANDFIDSAKSINDILNNDTPIGE